MRWDLDETKVRPRRSMFWNCRAFLSMSSCSFQNFLSSTEMSRHWKLNIKTFLNMTRQIFENVEAFSTCQDPFLKISLGPSGHIKVHFWKCWDLWYLLLGLGPDREENIIPYLLFPFLQNNFLLVASHGVLRLGHLHPFNTTNTHFKSWIMIFFYYIFLTFGTS